MVALMTDIQRVIISKKPNDVVVKGLKKTSFFAVG